MRLSRSLVRWLGAPTRRQFNFCEKKQSGGVWGFMKDAWKQTFPNQEDEIKQKYKKVKNIKRYSEEELQSMQENIHEYQRTAMVKTEQQQAEEVKRKKLSDYVPDSVKEKVKSSDSYKQYTEFKENFKQYMSTSDSMGVNLANKAYELTTKPTSNEKATNIMRKYDREFSIMDLEKESTYLFRDAYNYFLQDDLANLEKICCGQAFSLFKQLAQVNKTKKIYHKFREIIDHGKSAIQKTVMGEDELPNFVFQLRIIEIHCLVNEQGEIVDGSQDRIMSNTYLFTIVYSGEHITELGHPWMIKQMHKVEQVKMLV